MKTIIIAGMPGTGKTTIAKFIAEKYNLDYYCGSDAFREMARKRGYKPEGIDWWDSEEGLKFLKERQGNSEFDKEVDRIMMEKARQGNIVLTSWTLPYLNAPGIKIWITASQEERAKRISGRDNTSFEQALEAIKKRDEENKKLYYELYGFKFGEDLEPFDLKLDTDKLNIEEVKQEITEFLGKVMK